MRPRRRALLLGGAAAAAGALVALRPGERGGPYPPYFDALNRTLRANGIAHPVLVLDLDRLDRNIDRVVRSVAAVPGRSYRIVVKSLPSPDLVEYVARRAGTNSLMSFHRPFLQAITQRRPDADVLMGKPMPVDELRAFYAAPAGRFDPAARLQWLVDTPQRLHQYHELARAQGLRLRISLEVDVGLHRGGFADAPDLAPALDLIAADPQHLALAGLMGYDAHLMGLPGLLVPGELARVKARYAQFAGAVRAHAAARTAGALTFNGAGSPTLRHYEGDSLLNDLSAGTCLVKPSHYDLATLADFEPAAFIATPVLKRLEGARLPTLEWTGPLARAWDPNLAQTVFIYGGNWMADAVAPPGLTPDSVYQSSNQQGWHAPASTAVAVDDFVFLRPWQSEAVLLQFGDLLALRGGRIEARWPVLAQGS